ncbi:MULTISPECIES: hypothetical protein [unclassified Clostridium]|uniref:hypothetical protein n=1 Tax=unclassified Clostridium TaxID=2614128 RepID=UPI0025C2C49A|nr:MULTISPECIES: hypothetical protein [unclassified Clostridium]
MKGKNLVIAMLIIILIPVIGYAINLNVKYSKQLSEAKEENVKLTTQVSSLDSKNATLNKEVSSLKEQLNKDNGSKPNKTPETSKGTDNPITGDNTNNLYAIYTANIDSYEKELLCYLPINSGTLTEKLDILAKNLSKIEFNSLPIEVTKIEDKDGKKIAVINLKESEINAGINEAIDFKGPSWSKNYFQGSAGGTITSTALIESFLQRSYPGQWIDGVRFLYENKEINFQHVSKLSEINYK